MRRFTIRSFIAFTREERASILPTFAIALVPLVGAVGASVDYSHANQVRSSLQSALDAAILAAVRDGTADWSSTAQNLFNVNLQLQGVPVQPPSFTKTASGKVSGSVSAVVPTTFLGVLGISSVPVTVNSSADVSNSATAVAAQYCVLALNNTAQPGLRLTGNATINIKADQCILRVNSNATGGTGAVNMTGNASIKSKHNCFVGSTVTVGNATVDPPSARDCAQVKDPFSNYLYKPAVGPCTITNYSVSGNKTVVLEPGVYCGGMQFSGQVNVTFKPGIYIVKDGPLQASSGASFTGDDVAFYLTGSGAAVDLSGQASVHLVGRKSGEVLTGFVFFLEPSGPSGLAAPSSQLSGSSDLYFEGVIYLPQQLVNITGSAEVDTPSPFTSFIADRIDINGNGTLVINNDLSKTTIPVPNELKVTLDARPRLLQ
jgi:Flp pilus assembly protein TadG